MMNYSICVFNDVLYKEYVYLFGHIKMFIVESLPGIHAFMISLI